MNIYGEIVKEEWLKTATIRKEVTIDEFVVMPNHVHGILFIKEGVGVDGRPPEKEEPRRMHRAHSHAPLQVKSKSLGSIIAGFKSALTKRINALREMPGHPVWQRNYHDRVIRDEVELAKMQEYIHENPLKWHLDRENPEQTGDGV